MKSIGLLFLILFPIVSGLFNYFINRGKSSRREWTAIFISVFECAVLLFLYVFYQGQDLSCSFLLFHFRADGFRMLYSFISIILWIVTLFFSKEYMAHYQHQDRYYLFYLWTLGAVLGVFLSDDLWTTFVFFEMMALTSFVLVLHEESKEAMNAAYTYLVISIVSGMILLMGLFLIQGELNTLSFSMIRQACSQNISTPVYIGGICLLIGFGAKAGMFPLHIWLPKAHAVAPAPASALLSGILTKSGVFGLIILCTDLFYAQKSFGVLLLILALITMLVGAVLAVFSNHLKRTLACSSMSQIGFILTGLAMYVLLPGENNLAFQGTLLHMVNHSFIKLILFVIAGVVVMNLHQLNLNAIRGFGRKKGWLNFCFLMAMLGIMGIPLWNGYISKTLLHESILEAIQLYSGPLQIFLQISEWVFLLSGGLTIAYMLKLYVAIFIEKNADPVIQQQYDQKRNYVSLTSKIFLGFFAVLLLFAGLFPQLTFNQLSIFAKDFFQLSELHFIDYFSFENLKGAIISLTIGLLVYFLVIRLLLMKKEIGQKRVYCSFVSQRFNKFKQIVLSILKALARGLICIIRMIAGFLDSHLIKMIALAFAYLIKAISEWFDAMIYLIRRYVLRQYQYQFDHHSLSYKMGNFIDKIMHDSSHRHAHEFEETFMTLNDIDLTLASTFSFSLLMACIGLVSVLIYVLFVFFR